jgi:hypothetical protein
VDEVRTERFEDVFVVTAKGHDKSGRSDSATGAVTVGSLKGDALANQIMKAETKAKRRFTLSICGLGFLDETEIETIPKANVEDRNYEVNQSAPVKCDKCEKEIVGITKDDGGKLTALQIVAFSEKKFNASWCWDCTVAAVNAERAAAPPADTRHPAVQAMAQRQAAREPDPHFIIDTQGKPVVAGTVTEIAETAKSFQVKFGKERLSTFPNRSICEFLRGAKGQKVILEYSISGDGKYKNIESIRKIGNRDFVDNVPAYQLNEDPDPVPADVKQGAISIPSDEELPF